ncbi:MAG: class I SAM-dependent methyltransferase [Candidatus Bathyarchaeota archaeon]|nr:class I SAM-dependent methyltransferase [Candidatus Bathyarchaeota archaeon]
MTSVVNWNETRKLMLQSTRRIKSCNIKYWDMCALDFNKKTASMHTLTQDQINKLPLTPAHTVLEIGAGTGRITIPIAKKVKHVTAVEPSLRMLAFLKANAERSQVKNITCINKPWENINTDEVSPHDFVIASFSFFMIDLAPALLKMHILANEKVYLFLSASNWMEEEIQKILFGNAQPEVFPDHVYIYNILNELGITANVEVWTYLSEQRYADLSEVTSRFMELYDVPADKKEHLKEYLLKILVPDEGGLWLKQQKKVAMLWWSKEE